MSSMMETETGDARDLDGMETDNRTGSPVRVEETRSWQWTRTHRQVGFLGQCQSAHGMVGAS